MNSILFHISYKKNAAVKELNGYLAASRVSLQT